MPASKRPRKAHRPRIIARPVFEGMRRELMIPAHAALRVLERLREFERSAALTLPGVYYMDPPDGGDVSLLKQLQRSSIDAARYRLLRRKFAIISDGNGNAEVTGPLGSGAPNSSTERKDR